MYSSRFCVLLFFNQSAVGSNYVADVEKHSSQTDAAKGFGGKYGVQKDRQDKVCYPQSWWLIYGTFGKREISKGTITLLRERSYSYRGKRQF